MTHVHHLHGLSLQKDFSFSVESLIVLIINVSILKSRGFTGSSFVFEELAHELKFTELYKLD